MSEFDLNKLIRENIKKLQAYSSARDEFDASNSQYIFVDANENPFENGMNRYPDPYQKALKSKLSSIKSIPVNQILIGNGSDEILDLLFRIFCKPSKDSIITLPPTYGMYKVLAELNDIKIKNVILDNDFQPYVDKILKQELSKILFLCSPNNPTGNLFETSRIEKILKYFKGIVVIDEAYIDFAKSSSWTTKLKEYPNLIVTQTLSKAYGLAGLRLGVCYASKEIISILNKIKPPYNVSTLSQKKALKYLDSDDIKSKVKTILDEKNKIENILKKYSFIEKIYPSDANFILIKVDDAKRRYNQLQSHQIVVRNRSKDPLCENTLRISVGTPDENKKLVTVLSTLGK